MEAGTGAVRRVSRKGVLGLCDRLQGEDGRAVYLDGGVVLEVEGGESVAVSPPFALEHQASYDTVETRPLAEHLRVPRRVGLLIVRLGGYAAAVYDDERLVEGKAGARFVKNRNRAGGSSSTRFRRRREEQARDLHDRAAALAEEVLLPAASGLDDVVLAGDRFALAAVGERSPALARLIDGGQPAAFTVGDVRSSQLADLARELWSSSVIQTRS